MKLCPLFESIELPELIQPGNVPMTPHNVRSGDSCTRVC